jgi:hypothetical protein
MSEATDIEYDTYIAKWGIVLSIISAVFTSTGLCLQKMHLKKLKASPDAVQSYSDTKYIAGISYVAIGLLLKAPICVMLPQVTIALMSAQTVLYSSILEFLFLKNQMSKVTVACLLAILIGIVVGVSGSTIGDPVYSFIEVWDLFFSFRAISFSLVCLACIFGVSECMRVAQIEPSASLRLAQVSVVAGLVAGLFGTFTKAVFEVLYFNTYYSTSRTFSWNAWVFVLPAIGLGLLKMRSVSSALREFPSWRFLPLYQVCKLIKTTCYNQYNSLHCLYFSQNTEFCHPDERRVRSGLFRRGSEHLPSAEEERRCQQHAVLHRAAAGQRRSGLSYVKTQRLQGAKHFVWYVNYDFNVHTSYPLYPRGRCRHDGRQVVDGIRTRYGQRR